MEKTDPQTTVPDNAARLHSLRRFLRHLERLGQSRPMNLAEQLWHAHRVRRTLAGLAKIERMDAKDNAARRAFQICRKQFRTDIKIFVDTLG